MDTAGAWKQYFENWPADLPATGVLVVGFGEQIPFEGFATSEGLLLVERKAPDTVGARRVLVPYGEIRGLKIVETVKIRVFTAAGFKAAGSKGERSSGAHS